jgi:hypothetical protein
VESPLPILSTALIAALVVLFTSAPPYGEPAPELRALLTPRHARDRYEVFVSDRAIDLVAEQFRREGSGWPRGAWAIERAEPLDAFGADGSYERYDLMQLFAGARPRVARGPLVRGGRPIGSVTLLSPYPDAHLRTLNPGTLVILTYLRTPTSEGLDPTRPR